MTTGSERIFNNDTDRIFFSDMTQLGSDVTYYAHVSDVVQKALQQSGVFSRWVFQATAPTDTTRVWVKNDEDPGPVFVYDSNTSSWIPATFERVFNITSVMTIEPWSNTQSYVTGNVVRASNDVIYIALTPTGPPFPAVDPISSGQVAWELLAPQVDTENEWTARQTFSANVSWPGDRPTGPGGFDLDTLTTPGRYSIDTTRDSNLPGSGTISNGVLEVHQREDQTLRAQILFADTNTIWFRVGNPPAWETWREITLNLANDFNWTGDHNFAGNTTFDGLVNINANAVWRSIASTVGNTYDVDDLILSGRYTIDSARDTNLPGTETSGILEVTSVTGDGLVAQFFAGSVSLWYRRGTVTGATVVWQPFVQFASTTGGGFDFAADHTYTGQNTFQGTTNLQGATNIDGNADWPGLISTVGNVYDLDTLTDPGRFGIDSARDTNLPGTETQGVLEVQRRDGTDFRSQIFYGDTIVYYRSSTADPVDWSDWQNLNAMVNLANDLTFSGNNTFNGTSRFNARATIAGNASWLAPVSSSGNRFNADTLTTAGRYWLGVDDTGKPSAEPGLLEIFRTSVNGRLTATFIGRFGFWFRIYRAGAWEAWREAAQTTTVVSQDSETGAADMPAGTTAQRPSSPEAGWTRWNTTDNMLEFYNGSDWTAIGSSGLFPIGTILPALSDVAPPGMLRIMPTRQTLIRTMYPALFQHAQNSGNMAASETGIAAYQFGPGDGTTTFTIPGLDGVFLRAAGTNAALLGFGQTDAIRNITGDVSVAGNTGVIFQSIGASNAGITSGAFERGTQRTAFLRNVDGTAFDVRFNAANVVPTAADNRPANATVNYFIVAFQSVQSPELLSAANVVSQVNQLETDVNALQANPAIAIIGHESTIQGGTVSTGVQNAPWTIVSQNDANTVSLSNNIITVNVAGTYEMVCWRTIYKTNAVNARLIVTRGGTELVAAIASAFSRSLENTTAVLHLQHHSFILQQNDQIRLSVRSQSTSTNVGWGPFPNFPAPFNLQRFAQLTLRRLR